MKGYIHSVSPVKNAKSSNRKYFNFIVQEKESVVRAVCFTPTKHTELHTLQQTKSPVNVSNFVKTSQGDDVIFNHYTKITPLDSTKVDFVYSNKLSSTEMVKSISACNDLANEQLISLKAQVVQITGVKKIHTQHQGILKKQEVVLRDTTSCIKAVLWGCYVDTLTENTTYVFKNFKLKIYRGEKYLNTPKSDEFEATETTPFDQELVDIDVNVQLTSATISGKIIGVQGIAKTVSCPSCKKNVVALADDDLFGECQGQGCKALLMLDACDTQITIRILVQSTTDPSEKKRLVFYNQEVQQLKETLDLTLDLTASSERNIMVAILRAGKEIKAEYDSLTSRVNDVALV